MTWCAFRIPHSASGAVDLPHVGHGSKIPCVGRWTFETHTLQLADAFLQTMEDPDPRDCGRPAILR
jgi:hypothetical protein